MPRQLRELETGAHYSQCNRPRHSPEQQEQVQAVLHREASVREEAAAHAALTEYTFRESWLE